MAPLARAQVLARRRLRLIPREVHPWARFKEGAWRVVRTETTIFGKDGKIVERTQTEAATEFVGADAANCNLAVATRTLVPGSEVEVTPREVSLPIDPEGETEVKTLPPEVITVSGQPHRVEVRQAKLTEKTSEKLMTVHLANENPPRVLKRETKVVDPKNNEPRSITRTEVVKLDVKRPVAGENRLTREVRTIHEFPAGKVETTEYLCDEVPGEVVYQESQEFDASGKLVRRSTVELQAFGKDNDGRRRLFGRRDRERRSL